MLPSNPIPQVCDYGSAALYRELPNEEQIRSGVVPLDSLPAAWWNCMWYATNQAVNCARYAAGALIDEINTVLTQAGVCVCDTCVDQLYTAINNIRQTIGTAATAGAVKSSSCPGEVSINAQGIMTANCVGNAAALTTVAHTIVGAVNELKSTYDCCISDLNTATGALNTNKAPVNHASTATTYGVGNATTYGHVKLSDTYSSCVGGASESVAASQKALYEMYQAITSAGYVVLGNTAGCALGTASAGSCSTAARSDHVHPLQSGLPTTGLATCCFTWLSQSNDFLGAPGWAHYLISTHGDGSCYYNYIIREPFYSVPQYSRMVEGVQSPWYNFITDENIGSQSVAYAHYADLAGEAACAGNAAHLEGYQLSGANVPSTIPLRTCDGFIYASFYNASGPGDDSMSNYPGSSIAFLDPSGWIRKTPPSRVCVGCACAAIYAPASYLRVSTCSFIGGGIANIYYCARNYDIPWLTQSYVVVNGIKAGSSCQFDLSTFSELTKINTADGKTLGLLCVDQQWHLLANCADAIGGIFTNTYHAQLAGIAG